MNSEDRIYIAIDLKSFYASVECVERNLNPLTTNLVVADLSRTEKTICLAVSPALKSYGIGGRARLFEVVASVAEVNKQRKSAIGGDDFEGKSTDCNELAANKKLELDYYVATPQMYKYITYSSKIYDIYLKYIASEDIHVYSIDEVFMDVTGYLGIYNCTAKELCMRMIQDVLNTTGITATAGIGTNLYLCKIAMDIVAKHIEADENGVRIAELNERSYRELLWEHKPITDFWRIGRGIANKLAKYGMYTMGDIALCALGKSNEYHNGDLLYKLFGINAELIIDHAFGYEPCTISDIKSYKPECNSLSSGQVLKVPYDYDKTRIVVAEMVDLLVLDMVDKGIKTNQVSLYIGYDSLGMEDYEGEAIVNYYGKIIPKYAAKTYNFPQYTSSTEEITKAVISMFDDIFNPKLYARRLNISANRVKSVEELKSSNGYEQLSLFDLYSEDDSERKLEKARLKREENIQQAMLDIKKKYGKNAIIKGMNLQEGATAIERNSQIGGHRA